jgi:heme-degrading monooxygenase HmoA
MPSMNKPTLGQEPGKRVVGPLEPPYFVVIFTSLRTEVDEAYTETARRMIELAAEQPGFLGVESAREGALGITVSYWSSEEAIRGWRANGEHREAQRKGRTQWYREYGIHVAKVERAHGFTTDRA